MENDLEKQLIPYLEPIVNQTLDIIEGMFDEGNFNEGEINELLYQLQDNFGEYINILSPQIRGKISKIHDKLLGLDNIYDPKDL
jgi:hypothetical protein